MRIIGVVGCVVALVGSACGGGDSPTAPSAQTPAPAPTPTPPQQDSIAFVSATPSNGTTLTRGQTVTFSGTANYTLVSSDTGTIAMVIQDQAQEVLSPPGTQQTTTVPRGTGQRTLSQSIALTKPNLTSVRITFLLAREGAASTGVVAVVSYPVQ